MKIRPKKRYGLSVLYYIATFNHSYLIVVDTGFDFIPMRSIDCGQGCTRVLLGDN